jgi:hypothetical protein
MLVQRWVSIRASMVLLATSFIYICIYANRVMIVPYPSELLPMTSSHVRLGEQELFFSMDWKKGNLVVLIMSSISYIYYKLLDNLMIANSYVSNKGV